MREKRTFAKRTQVRESDDMVKKYFLVYEGADTEDLYFEAINSRRDEVGINPLIELVPIVRSYSEEGWSNPQKILDRIIENIDESKTKYISYETLLNRIIDYFYEINIITSKIQAASIWRIMCRVCQEKINSNLLSDVDNIEYACDLICKELQENYELENIISDLSQIIKEGGITYSEQFDCICLIVDRDRDSFISKPENNQYEYVVNKCKEKNFELYVTNPCFEFWLLLHFDSADNIDKGMMLQNPKVSSKKRYVEHELGKVLPGYKKSSYPAIELVKNVDKAIENEKKFCENIDLLEYTLGSNVGKLIENLRK